MNNLTELPVGELAAKVRAGEVSPVETVRAALNAIEALDDRLNACCQVQPEVSLAAAETLEQRIARGDDPGPLAGVPIGVKDLEDVAGWRTTYGDPAHADDAPAARNSVEVERLLAAGCIVVAKTNTPAYGFHGETDNLVFGPTRNPWAESRTPGGSSGGTAAAVAAGMLPLATGSDGGGSIRIPSATCGISGFKPSHGVVPSSDGFEPPVWGPFSTKGPMADTFGEVALALDVIKGATPLDLLSTELPGSFADAAARPRLNGLRIAWCPKPNTLVPDAATLAVYESALKTLEDGGATVEAIDTVFPESPMGAWLARSAVGCWRVIGPDREAWEGRFLPAATALANVGEHITVDDLLEGEDTAHRCAQGLVKLFDRFDVVVTPAMAAAPPRVGEEHPLGPGWAGDFTLPFNLTRSPGAVVRAGFVEDDGERLPVALQLLGPRLGDLTLTSIAAGFEEALDAGADRPPVHIDA